MSGHKFENNRFFLYVVALVILCPISVFESMKSISYISMTAMLSILVALIYVMLHDIQEIAHPTLLEKETKLVDFSGLPFFFGTALFMFEGNAVALEISYQMEDGVKKFTPAMNRALLFACSFIILIGGLSYAAYGQFT